MRPLRGGAGGWNSLQFRAAATTSGSALIAKPAGIAIGDVVLVVVPNSTGVTLTTSVTGDVWSRSELTWPTLGYHSVLFYKKLVAGDLSNNWTASASVDARACAWFADLGVGSIGIQDTTINNGGGQSTLVLSGFTPAATLAVIAVAVERDATTPGTPVGFVSRSASAAGAWICAFADAEGYAGGNVTFTGMNAGAGFDEVGWLLEIKEP